MNRRRASERGAALVEAVVAIPFFLILFASVIFSGQTYSEKLRVMRDSKQRVWTYAMASCGEGGNAADATGITKGSESNGNNGGADTSTASNAAGAPHADVINKDLGSASITVDATVTASELLGGTKAKQSSYRKVMCNEPAYDGDIVGTMKAAYHDITNW